MNTKTSSTARYVKKTIEGTAKSVNAITYGWLKTRRKNNDG